MKIKTLFTSILVVLLVAPLWAEGPNGPSASSQLTEAEEANILYLYEEEKLARDIYVEMYIAHGAYIFNRISESEQRHMDAVEGLIIKYGLDDTVSYNEHGIFTNGDLQEEYDHLLEYGLGNITSALEVGVAIEEMDITDIEDMLNQTDKADIQRVLSNLLRGSYNHLEAFNRQLDFVPLSSLACAGGDKNRGSKGKGNTGETGNGQVTQKRGG